MKNKIFNLAILLLFAIPVISQVDRTKPPAAGPAPIIQLGKTETFTLPNGLKVFVIENNKLPKVSFSLLFDYDPILEGDNAGFVKFTGELLKTGTSTKTKDQIDEQIDFIGASLNTSAEGIYASSLKKHSEKLLEILSDILLNPKFNQDELDKLKKQSKTELEAQKEEPNAIANRIGGTILFGKNHPYGELETDKSIDNITIEMCNKFYKTFFKPNVSYLAVVGNTNVQEIKPLIEKYFGKWQKADVPTKKYDAPVIPQNPTVVMYDKENAVQSIINVTYPVDLKPGTEDAIKVKVMNEILGGGVTRLFSNLREKHGWTYGAYSRLSSDPISARFYAFASVRNVVTDSSITEILSEMNKLKSEKVNQDELTLVKNFISGKFALSLEDPQSIASYAVNVEKYKLPKDYYANFLKKVSDVSIEDVLTMSKKYMKPENAYIFVVGNSSDISDKLKKFSKDGKIKYFDFNGNVVNKETTAKAVPTGITAETVVKKYITAIGAEANIKKIEDVKMKMTTTMQGMSLVLSQSQKAPNKSLTEISMNGNVMVKQVFDGVKGQVIQMGNKQDVKDNQLEQVKAKSTLFLETKFAEIGAKLILIGVEQVNGKDAYKVEVDLKDGSKFADFYSVETGLKVKSVSAEEGSVEFSDYKEANGVKFPYTISQTMGPQNMKFNVESIEINTKIKDDVFEIK